MSLTGIRQLLRERGGFPVGERGRISLDVPLGGRHHRVLVTTQSGWVRVHARAAQIDRVADPRGPADVLMHALDLNTSLELVSIQREDGWLTVRADLPSGRIEHELLSAVHRVARTADRLELLWEGGDDL